MNAEVPWFLAPCRGHDFLLYSPHMLTRSSGLQDSGKVDWHLVAADTCSSDTFWQLAKWDEKWECCSCLLYDDLFLGLGSWLFL